MKMQMIGLLFLWKIPETACVLSYLVEKSQFDNYKLLSAAVNAPFEPIKNIRRPNHEHSLKILFTINATRWEHMILLSQIINKGYHLHLLVCSSVSKVQGWVFAPICLPVLLIYTSRNMNTSIWMCSFHALLTVQCCIVTVLLLLLLSRFSRVGVFGTP